MHWQKTVPELESEEKEISENTQYVCLKGLQNILVVSLQ